MLDEPPSSRETECRKAKISCAQGERSINRNEPLGAEATYYSILMVRKEGEFQRFHDLRWRGGHSGAILAYNDKNSLSGYHCVRFHVADWWKKRLSKKDQNCGQHNSSQEKTDSAVAIGTQEHGSSLHHNISDRGKMSVVSSMNIRNGDDNVSRSDTYYDVESVGNRRPFFRGGLETGGHSNSLLALISGQADVAAIDINVLRRLKKYGSHSGGSDDSARVWRRRLKELMPLDDAQSDLLGGLLGPHPGQPFVAPKKKSTNRSEKVINPESKKAESALAKRKTDTQMRTLKCKGSHDYFVDPTPNDIAEALCSVPRALLAPLGWKAIIPVSACYYDGIKIKLEECNEMETSGFFVNDLSRGSSDATATPFVQTCTAAGPKKRVSVPLLFPMHKLRQYEPPCHLSSILSTNAVTTTEENKHTIDASRLRSRRRRKYDEFMGDTRKDNCSSKRGFQAYKNAAAYSALGAAEEQLDLPPEKTRLRC